MPLPIVFTVLQVAAWAGAGYMVHHHHHTVPAGVPDFYQPATGHGHWHRGRHWPSTAAHAPRGALGVPPSAPQLEGPASHDGRRVGKGKGKGRGRGRGKGAHQPLPPHPGPSEPTSSAEPSAVLTYGLLVFAGLCLLLSQIEYDFGEDPVWLSSAAFAANCLIVSLPGRFDGDPEAASGRFPWPTLINPAGFAFAIWGLIYVGELAGMLWLTVPRGRSAALSVVGLPARHPRHGYRAGSNAWVGGNLAQAAWCTAFRPWALDKLWLSTTLLATAAGCLYVSQRRLCARGTPVIRPGSLAYWCVAFPRSLHLGWLCAATIVNANAWVGMMLLHSRDGIVAGGHEGALAVAILSIHVASLIRWVHGE